MKPREILLAGVVALQACGNAGEANSDRWLYVGVSAVGDSLWVDAQGATSIDDGVQTWVKSRLGEEISGIVGSLSFWQFNCQTRHVRVTQMILYRENDDMESSSFPDADWVPVGPSSGGEGVLDMVCEELR